MYYTPPRLAEFAAGSGAFLANPPFEVPMAFTPQHKPPFTVEIKPPDEYVIVDVKIRSRRDWRTVPVTERFALLLDMADVLDEAANGLREQAEALGVIEEID